MRTGLADERARNVVNIAAKGKYARHHIAPPNLNISSDFKNPAFATPRPVEVFQEIVGKGHPDYWGPRPRAPAFVRDVCERMPTPEFAMYYRTTATGVNTSNCDAAQVKYLETLTANDAALCYNNPKYPWLLCAHKYGHNDYTPDQDAVIVKFPASTRPGRYLIHWIWQGYYDVMDVHVVDSSADVVAPYGRGRPGPAPFTPVDHCIFEDARGTVGDCIEIVTTARQCQAMCANLGACRAYAILPIRGPAPYTTSTQIPWGTAGCNATLWKNVPANTYLCYLVSSFRLDQNGVLTPYTIIHDPDDIGFYGTCYLREPAKDFDLPIPPGLAPDPSDIPFAFGDTCIECSDRYAKASDANFVDWRFRQSCLDCDLYLDPPRTRTVPSPVSTLVGAGFFNRTAHTCGAPGQCLKWLSPLGSPYAFEDECKVLADRDPECSAFYAFSPSQATAASSRSMGSAGWVDSDFTQNRFRSCACWKVDACCGTPSRDVGMRDALQSGVAIGNYSVYRF